MVNDGPADDASDAWNQKWRKREELAEDPHIGVCTFVDISERGTEYGRDGRTTCDDN